MSEQNFDPRTLQNKLRQVQALLDRAEHPNTPPEEAASSRAKAEAMMAKYRIEEEEARQGRIAQGLDTIKPIVDEFPICDYNSQYRDHYVRMMYAITEHVGNIRMAYKYVSGQQTGYLVGFESDVKFAETLYTALRLHFANTLEPKYDPSVSLEENVYRMRTAGMERSTIAKAIWPEGRPKGVPEPSILYKRACEQRGEDPKVVGRGVNVKTYRQSFADAYVGRISTRLWEMAQAEPGTGLQLRGRKDAVDEAFYERFPNLRPIKREDRQIGEGVRGGPLGNCPKCRKAKSGYCRDHNYLKPSSASYSRPHSSLGASQGRSAANSADLGNKGGSGNRLGQ
jgi:hypothetical protein